MKSRPGQVMRVSWLLPTDVDKHSVIMSWEYLLHYAERMFRGFGFFTRFLMGVVAYEWWEFHQSSRVICGLQTPLCRALRLTNVPRDITVVYGFAETDKILRRVTVFSNLVCLVTYPFEFALLLAECHIIPGSSLISYVNIYGWIAWLSAETIRWIRQGYLANKRLLDDPEPVFYLVRSMALTVLLGNCMDFVIAINWLPLDILWSDKVPLSGVGCLGVLSTVLCVYRLYLRQVQDKLG